MQHIILPKTGCTLHRWHFQRHYYCIAVYEWAIKLACEPTSS